MCTRHCAGDLNTLCNLILNILAVSNIHCMQGRKKWKWGVEGKQGHLGEISELVEE